MAHIYETKNFEVVTHEKPFISREEGGHIKIVTKTGVPDRTKLDPIEAIELMRLTMLVGEAFEAAMNNRGVPVIKINYEDLGNWAYKPEYKARGDKPHLHIHLFGRALDAKKQVFPEAVYLPARESGFYDGFAPINDEDIEEIRKQITGLESTKKYALKSWGLAE